MQNIEIIGCLIVLPKLRAIWTQCIILCIFFFFCLDQGTSYRRSCSRNFEKGSFDWKFKGQEPFLIVKSDWRATNPRLTPTISQNTFNQNFEINIVERSRNYIFKDATPPHTAFKARVVSYALGKFKVYIERAITKTFEGAHSISNQKCPFLRFRMISEWIAPPPHTHTSCFPELHLIEILRWPFVVIKTSKRAQSI